MIFATEIWIMQSTQEIFIRNVRKFLGERGWNQSHFADKVGVSATQVSRWLKGENFPDHDNLDSIGKALGVPVFRLFMDHDPDMSMNEIDPDDAIRKIIELAGYIPPKRLKKKDG